MAPKRALPSDEMSFTELGVFLGVSRETARRICVSRKLIRYVQVSPRHVRVNRSDAIAYRDSCIHLPK